MAASPPRIRTPACSMFCDVNWVSVPNCPESLIKRDERAPETWRS